MASPNRHPTATSAAAEPRGPAPFPLRLMCSMTKLGSVPNVATLSNAGTAVPSVQRSLLFVETCTSWSHETSQAMHGALIGLM